MNIVVGGVRYFYVTGSINPGCYIFIILFKSAAVVFCGGFGLGICLMSSGIWGGLWGWLVKIVVVSELVQGLVYWWGVCCWSVCLWCWRRCRMVCLCFRIFVYVSLSCCCEPYEVHSVGHVWWWLKIISIEWVCVEMSLAATPGLTCVWCVMCAPVNNNNNCRLLH